MARPRTKSRTIGFRLSLEAYGWLEAKAVAKAMTVEQYLVDQLEAQAAQTRRLASGFVSDSKREVTPIPKGKAK